MTAHLPPPGGHFRTPDSLRHLHISDICRALIEVKGSVVRGAEKLDVPVHDLRRMTRFRRELVELLDEIAEGFLDEAEWRLRQAICDDSKPELALRASIWLLGHSEGGRARGYGPPSSPEAANVAVNVAVSLPTRWANGEPLPRSHLPPPTLPTRDDMPPDEPPPDEPPE
jgi:hypothetical protein